MDTELHPHLTRQLDIIPLSILKEPISIVGAGAIGSFTALTLAKMGFENLTVMDFDEVSVENMNSQFYRFSDVGKKKVLALQDLIQDFTGVTIKAIDGKYESGELEGIVIAAVDSMAVRRTIWKEHGEKSIKVRFIIDPRMGAEIAVMHVVSPLDMGGGENYVKTLHTDTDSVQEACTAKATMYCATMLSGLVANTVVQCLTDANYAKSVTWSIKDHDMEVVRKQGDIQIPFSVTPGTGQGTPYHSSFTPPRERESDVIATEPVDVRDDASGARIFLEETLRNGDSIFSVANGGTNYHVRIERSDIRARPASQIYDLAFDRARTQRNIQEHGRRVYGRFNPVSSGPQSLATESERLAQAGLRREHYQSMGQAVREMEQANAMIQYPPRNDHMLDAMAYGPPAMRVDPGSLNLAPSDIWDDQVTSGDAP